MGIESYKFQFPPRKPTPLRVGFRSSLIIEESKSSKKVVQNQLYQGFR